MTLEPGIHYIVTKGSDDGTLKVGDHIWLEDNLVHCREASKRLTGRVPWITMGDIDKALQGVEVTVDSNWLATSARMTQVQQVQSLNLLRDAVMSMQFTRQFDRSLTSEEQEWLNRATMFLTEMEEGKQ
jgi:hypothetical protein